MTLIIVLISIALENMFAELANFREYRWFKWWERLTQDKLSWVPFWAGPVGVLVVVGLPLWLVHWIFSGTGDGWFWSSIAALLVVLYSLGPKDLSSRVEAYVTALTVSDMEEAAAIGREIAGLSADDAAPSVTEVTQAMLVEANERMFAVLVWFAILGPVGALLFRLSATLDRSKAERSTLFSEYALNFHQILAWLPARLFACGFAVGGSLIHTFERWHFWDTLGLQHNAGVLHAAGYGALQMDETGHVPTDDVDRVNQIRSLIGRTLFIWLVVLALATLVHA